MPASDTAGMDDDDDDSDWTVDGPYGDTDCQCPCGHREELMPEDDGWCANCLAGIDGERRE